MDANEEPTPQPIAVIALECPWCTDTVLVEHRIPALMRCPSCATAVEFERHRAAAVTTTRMRQVNAAAA